MAVALLMRSPGGVSNTVLLLMVMADMAMEFFFFNDTATTEIYTLPYTTLFRSCKQPGVRTRRSHTREHPICRLSRKQLEDRKSTRLNSSHITISYAVFCLKK